MNNRFDQSHDNDLCWAALCLAVTYKRPLKPEEAFDRLHQKGSEAIMRQILRLRADGFSLAEIGDELGMTRSGVHRRLTRYEKKTARLEQSEASSK